MSFILDSLIFMISLIFLGILGTIAGVLLPSLFLAAFAPWLDWILPRKGEG